MALTGIVGGVVTDLRTITLRRNDANTTLRNANNQDGLYYLRNSPGPTIQRFTTLPLFLLRGATGVVNFDGRWTPSASTGVYTDAAGNVVANGVAAPAADERYRLRVTDAQGRTADAYWTLLRALAPVIDSFTAGNYRNAAFRYSWDFAATIRCHPAIEHDDLTIVGSVAGQLRGVSARQLTRTAADTYQATWTHSVGGSTPPPVQDFTLTVINRDGDGNEIGRASSTLQAPS